MLTKCSFYQKKYIEFTFKLLLYFSFVQNGSSFVRYLSVGSVQMCGLTNSSSLPPVSPQALVKYGVKGSWFILLTMAAGLPHFSTGFMRCWGRDTFISMRGLLLVTGRFEAARYDEWGYVALR